MKNSYKQKRQQGFTIIEVLIVLAIAALILLIVFLAVPALQRNSRNTQRKNDVASILAGINEYATNNNGAFPASFVGTTTITWGAAASTTSETKVNYYNKGTGTASGDIDLHNAGGAANALTNDGAHDYVAVYEGSDCDQANPGKVVAAGPRSLAAQYLIENGSNTYKAVCQSS